MALTRDDEAICQVSTAPAHIESSGAAIMRPVVRCIRSYACCTGPQLLVGLEYITCSMLFAAW